MNPLLIDVSDVLQATGSEKRIRETVELASINYRQKELGFVEPIGVDITIRNVGDRLFAEGHISGRVMLECSRCLQDFEGDFCLEIEESFCNLDLNRDEEDVFQIIERKIDLYPLINQALLLWLPIKELCKVDCKGLCPKCGKNLNEGNCGCEKAAVDPRLKILGEFFKK